MKINQPEQQLQRAVAQYLDAVLPADVVWFHPPNGGFRTKAEAGIFKALGVKPGVPDIVIIWRGRAYFIELKATDGRLSQSQGEMHIRLQNACTDVYLCRSVDDVRVVVNHRIGIETKDRG